MKQKLWKNPKFWLTNITCLLPILVGLVLYPTLPEKVPIHFNFSFEPDSYGTKLLGVIGIPIYMLAITDLIWFVAYSYPKYEQIKNNKVLDITLWFIPILSCLIQYIVITTSVSASFNLVRLVPIFIGIFIIVVGNYLPKSRQNYFIGIRTPWSLSSKENWNKTNRLAGKVFIVSGFLMLIAAFFNKVTPLLLVVSISLIVIVPFVYSYFLYHKEQGKEI